MQDPIDASIGARLRQIRMLRQLSQTKLGDALGVSFQQIQKYESGANRVSASALVRLSRALEVSPVHFLEGFGNEASPADPLSKAVGRLSPRALAVVEDVVRSLLAKGV